MLNSGIAGFTKTIIAPTCCRSKSTASRSITTTSLAAWDRIVKKNYVHKTAQFFTVGWSANFWRIEAQTEKDFEWFEHKYPGWYAEFGDFWKWQREALEEVPGETNILFNSRRGLRPTRTGAGAAWFPCLIREDFCCDEVDGKIYTYCSEAVPLDPQGGVCRRV